MIGAGIAGLTAARQLVRFGYSVEILEARDRIGGRIYTDKASRVDLGAMIVTGTTGNPCMMLCNQIGLKTHEIRYDK